MIALNDFLIYLLLLNLVIFQVLMQLKKQNNIKISEKRHKKYFL